MSLIKWNPEQALFPAWVDDFFTTDGWPRLNMKPVSMPAVNVTENKDAFNMEVAAPGFKKEDFNLEVKNGYLTISGEVKDEKETKNDHYTRKEFQFNSFSRAFGVPDNVAADMIQAEYKDGMLRVTLPKVKVAKEEPAKPIPVH
jgi:HSP20 family protein